MSFADLFKKGYRQVFWCNNCQTHQEVQVPKGITATQFIESGTGKCGNCGCNTLVLDYEQMEEFRQRKPGPKMEILRDQPPQRASIPAPRPSTKPQGYKPLPKEQPQNPFEIKKIFKKDPVDFWTGRRRADRIPRESKYQEEEYKEEEKDENN